MFYTLELFPVLQKQMEILVCFHFLVHSRKINYIKWKFLSFNAYNQLKFYANTCVFLVVTKPARILDNFSEIILLVILYSSETLQMIIRTTVDMPTTDLIVPGKYISDLKCF